MPSSRRCRSPGGGARDARTIAARTSIPTAARRSSRSRWRGDDLDEAYTGAREAQREWAARIPKERAEVMRRAAGVDPSDPDTHLGPVINSSQLDGVVDKVRRAVEDGAEVLVGGEAGGPSGLLLPPHVLAGSNDVATAREEMFGPVITAVRADGEEHALELANHTEYGLSSAVFSRDVERAVRFALRVEAGMTHVNDSPVNDDSNTAFGGEKASGLGRFGGHWALEEFTTDHWITVQHERRTYAI
jgi:aldehyde dehydrogenase (NAD+)